MSLRETYSQCCYSSSPLLLLLIIILRQQVLFGSRIQCEEHTL